LLQPPALVRLDRNNGNAELPGQLLRINVDAEPFGDVDHVQRHDHGHAEFEGLRRQIKVALQVGRIHDGDDDVRPGRAGLLAEDNVHGHHLVRAARGQAVGAGQVDEVDGTPGERAPPLLRLDGDAGIVADALVQAGQGVEQRGLARVRVADQGHGERRRLHVDGGHQRVPASG
jgi:hypothetical protein